jgi:diacylglycerol kinase (ATP)
MGGMARMLALAANSGSRSCDPDEIARRLRAFGAEVELFGIEQVEEAARSGAERLAVAGGDGSLGSAAAAAGAAGVPLAVVPTGTANDFARRLGLPRDLAAACRLAARGERLAALELGWIEPLEGEGGGRPFVNVASAGLPAPAARRAAAWKPRLGPLAYKAGALVAGLTADPLECRVVCGSRELFAGRAWQVTVACTGAFGGGAEVEAADPADGVLDVVAIPAGPRAGLAELAYRLRTGSLTDARGARHAQGGEAVVEVAPGTPFNVDGEVLERGPSRFRADPAAFRLVLP